jgi:hypothetical protein
MKLPKEAHVVVMERDLSLHSRFAKEGAVSRGPITWETYLDKPISKQAATEQGQRMTHNYGKFIVCKLVPVSGNGYEPVGLIAKIKHLLAGLFGRKGA